MKEGRGDGNILQEDKRKRGEDDRRGEGDKGTELGGNVLQFKVKEEGRRKRRQMTRET